MHPNMRRANDPHRRDFLTDGYISYTFSPRLAEMYLAYLFKLDPTLVRPFGHPSRPDAFFVSNPPVNPSPPSLLVQGRPTWLLDYVIRQGGSVVPQELWFPRGQGDWRRYVEQAQLHVPVFFVNVDGSLGVPVVYAAAGQMSLIGANEPAPLGDRTTTKIRIGWPGYPPSEQQVQLRDQTPGRNPVTLERFVKHLGSRVRQFLADCERAPLHDPNAKWLVGYGRITYNEVMLIGVVQVSAGSWMPILQLVNRVVM
ncbi:hypothetical protein BC826DRAFT_968231 [Russula brevipes]|nr:hypothetical protein BC826DRAFT_968231 [Russula brevipes]